MDAVKCRQNLSGPRVSGGSRVTVARLFCFLVATFSFSSLWAQQQRGTAQVPNTTGESNYRLGVQTNVVIVRAVVRDSHGRAVAGLRKEDFRIADNRRQQDISGFSVETAPGNNDFSPRSPAPGGPATTLSQHAESRVSGPRIFLALYFDDLNSAFDSVVRSRDAAEKFIAGLPATERVAIFTSSGALSLDFTDDRQLLHDALFRLRPNSRVPAKQDCMGITDFIADRIVNHDDPDAYRIIQDQASKKCGDTPSHAMVRSNAGAAFTMYVAQARMDLAGLNAIVDRMARMPGERQVMLVSDGFMPLDMRDLMERTIDHALRSRVVISALVGEGLAVNLREADASSRAGPNGELAGPPPGGKDPRELSSADAAAITPKNGGNVANVPTSDLTAAYYMFDNNREAFARATLADIAEGTGGQFVENTNDLLGGFRRFLSPPEVSYILSYRPSDLKPNGAFHQLNVTLVKGRGLTVQARKGYFAPNKKASRAQQTVGELADAIFSSETIQGLPIQVQTHLIQEETEAEQAEVETKLDVRGLPFKLSHGRKINYVFFIVALFDHDGKYVMGNQQEMDLDLTDSELADMEKTGLIFRATIPGRSRAEFVRVVVREIIDGKMAALSTPLKAAPQEAR